MALGVLEATSHDPCSIWGVNTFLKRESTSIVIK